MRKIIVVASILMLFVACGGDDNTITPTPITPPTEVKTNEVTADDLVKFFNLDKQLLVSQALEKAKTTLGKKNINGKEFNVTAVSVVKSDNVKGTFTLKVTGICANKAFVKDVDFNGFAVKPSDYDMAKRAVASWKEGVNALTEFDFDALYRLKDTSKFTAEYLQKRVDLKASAINGSANYTFTADDWTKTTISDVRYVPDNNGTGSIAFNISYNGIEGKKGDGRDGSPRLSFSKRDYYATKVTVKTNQTKNMYMRGVYEHIEFYRSYVLNFDASKFVPYFESKHYNYSENAFDLTVRLVARDGQETPLATFTMKVGGFRPISDLSDELTMSTYTRLNLFFGKRFRGKADGDYTAKVKALSQKLWLHLADLYITRDNFQHLLYGREERSDKGNYNVEVWRPNNGSIYNQDVYLEDLKIEVLSAKKVGNFLELTYKFVAANEVSFNGKQHTFKVHLMEE